MALLHPPAPGSPRRAPFPKLRSRRKEILNVPMGQSRSWQAPGRAGEICTPPRLSSSATLLDDHLSIL